MPGKYYMLVNPFIEGSIPKIYKGDNSLVAANNAYKTISKYFSNTVDNFKFSLLKLKSDAISSSKKQLNLSQYGGKSSAKNRFDTKNFSHFIVSELKNNDDNDVSYTIKRYNGSINNVGFVVNNIIKLQNKHKSNVDNDSDSINQIDQEGGKKSKYELNDKELENNDIDDIDDDDVEDDSPDYYTVRTSISPISYFYYNPLLYEGQLTYLPIIPANIKFALVYPNFTIV